MKFWDASAVVHLLVQQGSSSKVVRIVKKDSDISTWWGTRIECVSALSRLARENQLDAGVLKAVDALQLAAAWVASENQPSTLEFVTLDKRLADAAAKEGFRVAE